MKKTVFLPIVTVMFLMVMAACKGKTDTNTGTDSSSKDEKITTNNVHILKSISYEEGQSRVFIYDEKKRIVRVEDSQYDEVESYIEIDYSSENSVTISYDGGGETFTRSGDTITSFSKRSETTTTLTLNKEGFISKKVKVYGDGSSGEYTYQYSGGNLIKETYPMISEYIYDNMNSIYNCNTPKWLIQYLFDISTDASKNNVSEVTLHLSDGSTTTYKYDITYNEDNYPTWIEWGADRGDYFYMSFEYF